MSAQRAFSVDVAGGYLQAVGAGRRQEAVAPGDTEGAWWSVTHGPIQGQRQQLRGPLSPGGSWPVLSSPGICREGQVLRSVLDPPSLQWVCVWGGGCGRCGRQKRMVLSARNAFSWSSWGVVL